MDEHQACPRVRAMCESGNFDAPCSMAVILFNKWILAYSGFPFPLALTMCVTWRWLLSLHFSSSP
jgi:hypothetical protein